MDDENRIQELKDSLDRSHDWPCVYVFKFIMPTSPNSHQELIGLFSVDVEIITNVSKNAKYTSLTIKAVVLSATEVLDRYAGANNIKGVISL